MVDPGTEPATAVAPTPEPPRGHWLARGAVTIAVGTLCLLATFVPLDLAPRISLRARWLADDRIVLALSFAVGIAAGALAWRTATRVRSPAWVFLPVGVFVLSAVVAVYTRFTFHLDYGTISTRCSSRELDVDECLRRDWSFMQDRHGFTWMRGRIEPRTCRTFEAGVAETPRSARTSDGWVACPVDRPEVWRRWSCGDLGRRDMHDCFVCVGRSDTNDDFIHMMAFDRSCTRAVFTYGVNVEPQDIATCSAAPTERECPSGSIGRFSGPPNAYPE